MDFWYSSQLCFVRWGTSLSVGFTVSNGVRQGGILSLLLFNFYMNDLSVVLNKVPAGYCSAGLIINHLMYADDLIVFAPSAKGLQKLLYICTDYGQNHDIIYNSLKSNLMLFDTQCYMVLMQKYINRLIASKIWVR